MYLLIAKIFYEWYLKERYYSYLEKKTEEIYNSLSWEKRLSFLFHIGLPEKGLTERNKKILESFSPGGVILFSYNLGTKDEIAEFTYELQKFSVEQRGIPLWISTDQEGGFVKRVLLEEIDFPSAIALGQLEDGELCGAVGFLTSYHLFELGISLFFAPVLDINNNPENPVIGQRSFGDTVEKVLRCALPFEKKAREAFALPVIKHFPGHGDTNRDSHYELPVILKTWDELKNFELIPFQKAISQGAKALMTAHILFPKIDSGFAATLSYEILTNKLQNEMGFSGLIFTDALEMKALFQFLAKKDLAKRALLAGADVLLLTSSGEFAKSLQDEVFKAFAKGEISPEKVEKSVKKQIFLLLERSPPSFFREMPDFAKKYLENLKKSQKEKFETYQKKYPNLPQLLAKKAIRQIGKREYLMSVEKTFFAVENPLLWKNIEELNSGRKLKNHKKGVLVSNHFFVLTDSYSQKDINQLVLWAKQHPRQNFIVLHYGTPFLKFPREKNIVFLLSLSPNPTALRELATAAFGEINFKELNLQLP